VIPDPLTGTPMVVPVPTRTRRNGLMAVVDEVG
jgi:hypothetical protein